VLPIVHPGGIRFGDIDVADRPRIERITPSTIGVGGRIRIDATYTGAPTRISVGSTRIIPPDLVEMSPGGPVQTTLPGAVAEDTYDVTLSGTGTAAASEAVTLVVVDATRPSVDAPDVLTHSRANDLVLTGRALGAGAVEVMFWPDSGISTPGDVVAVAATAASTTMTILAPQLAPLRNSTYRVSLHASTHEFTPYVLLEVTP
jgi:hypothetical protein